MSSTKKHLRFTKSDRIEHMVLLISFTMLVCTGIPQRYASHDLAQDIITLFGGIESVRVMHRFFATMLMAGTIYHGGALTYKFYVMGYSLSMLPSPKDALDAWHFFLYNIGLRKEHPKMPRYNFGEKAEYLALVWGTLLMIVTGFMMWNPIATAKILPGVVIPAARYAHSAEALLAMLTIILWHIYNTVIKRYNPSIFTGYMPQDMMAEEHGEELEKIERGEVELPPPPDIIASRMRRFVPYAVVMTILLVSALIYFVTFEDSAIETVPRQNAPEPVSTLVSE